MEIFCQIITEEKEVMLDIRWQEIGFYCDLASRLTGLYSIDI